MAEYKRAVMCGWKDLSLRAICVPAAGTSLTTYADPSSGDDHGGSMPWSDGTIHIDCDLQSVKASLADFGEHFVGVVQSMPGISEAELLDQGEDFVTIRTNEGV